MEPHIGILGFGEAGHAFAQGWKTPRVAAFDIKGRAAIMARAKSVDITACGSLADLGPAALVFSLVTADQVVCAAQSFAQHIKRNTLYFDGNSCAPETKRRAASVIENAGGRYVDMAILAPVLPKLHQTPAIICGPHAAAGLAVLTHLNMSAATIAGDIGAAAAVKMIRSVIVKGFEAVTMEATLAGARAGVLDAVLASLEHSDPDFGWTGRASYTLERMTRHGTRRAAEMREAVATVQELGVNARMSKATVDWQAVIGALELQLNDGGSLKHACKILAALERGAKSD